VGSERRGIPSFPGYEITSDGRVWSRHSSSWLTVRHHGRRTRLRVQLVRNGRCYTRSVAPLILEAHVGPRPSGAVCRHLNGDDTDNRLVNLRWGTQQENMQDCIKHGRHVCLSWKGQSHPVAKLSDADISRLRDEYHCGGITQKALAQKYGITERYAFDIIHNQYRREAI